jgi:beta-lactam-binding protein with PASTA domain
VFRFVANGETATGKLGRTPDPESDMAEISVPDVRGLDVRAAVRRLHGLGLKVEIHGSDKVTDQVPAAGMTAVRGASVILR